MSRRTFRDAYAAKGRVGAKMPAPTTPPPPRPSSPLRVLLAAIDEADAQRDPRHRVSMLVNAWDRIVAAAEAARPWS